jgi:phosphoribosylglycinamide formyltransferase-1
MRSEPIRIAVFVSGGGTNLQAILDAQAAGKIKSGTISLAFSNKKEAYALTRARENGIEAAFLRRKDFDEKLEPLMREYKIDMIVLAGFLCILPESFTRRYAGRMINIHPALIPSFAGPGYYGLHVHEAALQRGVKVTGATVHYVNEVCDGGEIIAQRAVRVLPGDTPETLQQRVMRQAEWKILPAAVEKVAKEIRNERV